MSSHHFVKEKQEPAVLIYAEDDLPEEILGELLEWSPVVCIHENALSSVNHLELKLDIIFVKDLSEDEIAILTNNQQSLTLVHLQTSNPQEEMIRYLISENHSAVSVLGYSSDAVKRSATMKNEIDLIFFTKDSKIYPFKKILKKWKTKGEKISLLSDEDFRILRMNNLKQIASGTFEVENDGVIELEIEGEQLLISESL